MQQKNPLILRYVTALTLLLFSCKKNIPASQYIDPPTTFRQVFDDFWNKMNTNYVYWDMDTTNWDRVYKMYAPIFDGLDINDTNDIKKSVGFFRDLTEGLIDSHYSISFYPDPIRDSLIFPALSRKIRAPDFHSPFPYMQIDSAYLSSGYIPGSYLTSDNQRIFALSGIISNKIIYFGCDHFSLLEAYQSVTNNGIKDALHYFFNALQNNSPDIKAILIDVRNNNGGNLSDFNFLMSHLISKPLAWGYTRYKSTSSRLDYTPWIESEIMPISNSGKPDLPIIVLADNYSVSLAESFTIAIRELPNSTFIGEPTWGATGPLTENILYNDGSFTIPNFLSVQTSSAEFMDINGKKYESTGILPDIQVPFNSTILTSGFDPALEQAITRVH